ncbi:hypothetical protein [Arenibacter certesii]|uniref:GTPase n=1 Tax=Arenibacter certesii TaxID=228955 RepID=A0A918MRU6_9FLAO|nr:hypothetical protein [Arenibacter certesii]GGW51709.1 hypothetical protein GCM10007383_38840 [Arenibacter certesii]
MGGNGRKCLIFVYNAKSGLGNSLLDGAHKILDPKSYSCSLCSITHGAFLENKRWKEFREHSDFDMEFLYKDQFIIKYRDKVGEGVKFPVIFEVDNGGFHVVLSSKSIDVLGNQESLIGAIQEYYSAESG